MKYKKRYRVVQLIHSLHIGGAERVVVDLAINLSKLGFDTVVCCVNEPGDLTDPLEHSGVPLVVANPPRSTKGVLNALHDLKPDVVHVHGIPALLHSYPMLFGIQKIKSVYTFHFGNYPHLMKKRYLFAERLLCRFYNGLVAVSNSQSLLISRHLWIRRDRLKVIPNGIDSHRELTMKESQKLKEFLNIDGQSTVVGCIAVLSRQKGIDIFLEAIAKLKGKLNSIQYLIVGGGPLYDDLRSYADKLQISDIVIFTDWKRNARPYLSIIDLFVMPSRWEAFSIALLEAMSAGKPIITTEIADHKRVLGGGEAGILVPPDDPLALAKAIETIVNDSSAMYSLSEKALSRFEAHYSIESMTNMYGKLYYDLLEDRVH